ncbi:MAG: K(+)-transporting ATPase subunit C [Bacteroidetes bacterium]|nr:K(+)-transporting ATPase subunit C [Bacteroidota bacterium]
MKQNILPAIRLTIMTIIFFCVVYTAFIWVIAQAAPANGNGETISVNGKIVGYALEGQSFTQDKYFWSRPSAVNYNAAGSAGSNKGPTNPDYLKDVQSRIDSFLVHNPEVKKENIPSELVTASGSGLDPDISPDGAFIQVARIAKTRNISEEKLRALINEHIEKPLFGLFGPSKINVLKLNITLDKLN